MDFLIEAENLEDLGGWVIDQQSIRNMGSAYIMAHGLGTPVRDAETSFYCEEEKEFKFWVRTRDWTAFWCKSQAGKFSLKVDDIEFSTILGTNGVEWAWQYVGKLQLAKGKHRLALHDLTGFNGRCDAIFITDNNMTPPNGLEELEQFRRKFLPEQTQDETVYDLAVIGGGVAGVCMALTASRKGLSVLLIHDREILGGCNSSEIRVCMAGGIFLPPYKKLGSIVKEIAPVMGSPCLFDKELYEDHRKRFAFDVEESISKCTLEFNRHLVEVEMDGNSIRAVVAVDIKTGERKKYFARLFADCTGDAVLSRLAGAEVMYGREARDVFNESLAPKKHEKLVMGHSMRWYSKHQAKAVAFPDVDFGFGFDDTTCLDVFNGDWEQESGFRRNMADETEYIRDYGLAAIFSNWAYQKNHYKNKEKYSNERLEWISYLGGKRESYRVVGDYVLTQNDIVNHIDYEDKTACMTWELDLHFPECENEERFTEAFRSFAYHRGIKKPYPVPYRCLYSKDIKNLFLGGRVVSVSHVAFSSIRVMRTLGMLGEVVGLAATLCQRNQCYPRDIYSQYLNEFKQLMEEGPDSIDSFACEVSDCEKYHFKDAGWISDGKPDSYLKNPYKSKILKNVQRLGIEHEKIDFIK